MAFAISASCPTAVHGRDCRLIRIDEWALRPDRTRPTVEANINGHDIEALLDTGMNLREGLLLERAAARRLGVSLRDSGREFVGLGGETKPAIGLIRRITIGKATRENWSVMVGGEEHGQEGSVIIGNRFFQDINVEFDLAHHVMRLFKTQDCRGVSLAYWAREVTPPVSVGEMPIWLDGHVFLDISINGQPVRAILDSGASMSLLDMRVATKLGVTTETKGTTLGPCFFGAGSQAVQSWAGQFDTFAIGNETIRNPRIHFADLNTNVPLMASAFFQVKKYDLPEMILGADFLQAHRVLIAREHGKMFFTYTEGRVFAAGTPRSCKIRPRSDT